MVNLSSWPDALNPSMCHATKAAAIAIAAALLKSGG